MQGWLTLLILVAAVASRPIEVRLWRAGRLSDRTLTVLLISRFPVVAALSTLVLGSSPLFILSVVAISAVPGVLLYRWALGLIEERGRELRKAE